MNMPTICIAHVVTRLTNGGAEENTLYTLNGLVDLNYDITLISGKEIEDEIVKKIPIDKNITTITVDSLCREISPIKDVISLFVLTKILKQKRYMIVHTHMAKGGILGRIAAYWAKVPIIVHSIHGTTFPPSTSLIKRSFFRCLERIVASITTFFVPVGEDVRDRYIKAGIGKADIYRVIHSGMDIARFKESSYVSTEKRFKLKKNLRIPVDNIVIGKIANLEKRKGHKYLLEAVFPILDKYPFVTVLIVGTGKLMPYLQRVIKKRGFEKRIIFTGYRHDVENIYAIIDILVLTSLWEGLPRVLVQGALAGKALISFDVEGAREVIQDGVNGFVVEKKDIETLRDKLVYLIENNNKIDEMSLKSKSIIDRSWSIENMIDETNSLYRELYERYAIK